MQRQFFSWKIEKYALLVQNKLQAKRIQRKSRTYLISIIWKSCFASQLFIKIVVLDELKKVSNKRKLKEILDSLFMYFPNKLFCGFWRSPRLKQIFFFGFFWPIRFNAPGCGLLWKQCLFIARFDIIIVDQEFLVL